MIINKSHKFTESDFPFNRVTSILIDNSSGNINVIEWPEMLSELATEFSLSDTCYVITVVNDAFGVRWDVRVMDSLIGDPVKWPEGIKWKDGDPPDIGQPLRREEYKKTVNAMVDAHWSYIEGVLKMAGSTDTAITQIGYHYKSAFVHGCRHGVELACESGVKWEDIK